jgi:hypothetical protein
MEFKRKITKVAIDGYGEYYVRSMTIGMRKRHKEIKAEIADPTEAFEKISLETVVSCLVDEQGNPAFKDIAELEAQDMGIDLFNALSNKILEVSAGVRSKDPETNLEKAPNSSLPSN